MGIESTQPRMPHSTKTDQLSAAEREKLIRPYLPAPRIQEPHPTSRRRKHRRRVRPFIKNQLHVLLYLLIQFVFGIYIRTRQIYHSVLDRVLAIVYHHNRTPELIQKDLASLTRLPEHLSAILTLRSDEHNALEMLMDEVTDLAAWCASAGIPLLSVYEKSGVLKNHISSLQTLAQQKLASYFGPAPACPTLRVFAPNHTGSSRSPSPQPSLRQIQNGTTTQMHGMGMGRRPHLNLLLLSARDGRDTLVDLTRTLTEMAQSQKLRPQDITAELIDAEISATTSVPNVSSSHSPANMMATSTPIPTATPTAEPDLLVIFGPLVKLQGYPPWQVRLTEIFCVGDSSADVSGYGKRRAGSGHAVRVEYQAFLRALWRFAGAEMRFGR